MLQRALDRPGLILRELMATDTVVLPGVFNAITAKAACAAGSKALYLSGAGVTNSLLAVPDIALLTQTEMAQQAAYVSNSSSVPVIADADTGYGETMNVARTVREMERAGLAGIHIEDQVSPKRCGHLDGKQVIEPSEMAKKIVAAISARRDESFLLIARTDARAVDGLDLAIDRAKLYADYGADAIFPEGLESEGEFETFRNAIKIPLLANMTEFGKTPLIAAHTFRDMGYNMVIFPMTAFRVMLKAVSEAYEELVTHGSQAALIDRMKTRQELYDLIDYEAYDLKDREWADQVGNE